MRQTLKLALILALSISLCSHVFAANLELDVNQETFVNQWIEAINTNNAQLLKEVVHPICIGKINQENLDYYNFHFSNDIRQQIPDKYQVEVELIDPEKAKEFESEEFFTFPITPTHIFKLNFKKNKYSGLSIVRYAVNEQDRWFIIMPHPTEKALAQFRENTIQQHKDKQKAKDIAKNLEPEFVKELRGLVKDGRQLKAYNLLKETKEISVGIARSVLQELKIVE